MTTQNIRAFNRDIKNATAKPKRVRRKTGEHCMADCGGLPRCVTCGCDEDEAFVGGQACSYGVASLQKYSVKVYQEVCTEVTVIAKKGSRKDTVIDAAHEQAALVPLREWEYVPDSVNTDPETDIQKID